MPINQPPITPGDPVRSSWDLEATNLINQLEQRLNLLTDTPTETSTGGGVVSSVDTSGVLNLNNGVLSNDPVVTTVNGQSGAVTVTNTGQPVSLNINNYPVTTMAGQVSFVFSTTPTGDQNMILPEDLDAGEIPSDRHQVFLGGLKLVEGNNRDYTLSGTTITLLPGTLQQQLVAGLILELVIFRV